MPARIRVAFRLLSISNNASISPAFSCLLRSVRRSSVLDLSVLMSGCAIDPENARLPELNLPSHWSDRPGKRREVPALGCWWRRLIKEPVEANPSIAKATTTVHEARAAVERNTAGLIPSVTGSGSATNTNSSRSTTGIKSGSCRVYDPSWEIDTFGGTQRGIEAALRCARAYEEDLRPSPLSLIGDAFRILCRCTPGRSFQLDAGLSNHLLATSDRDSILDLCCDRRRLPAGRRAAFLDPVVALARD